MANRLKCTECNHEFQATKGAELKCPECGSVHITFTSGSKKRPAGLLIFSGLLLVVAIIFVGLRFFSAQECKAPVIKEVKVDSLDHTIHIIAKASSIRCKLTYSIDNNKTGANKNPKFINVPPGQYYVCVIYGEGSDDRVMWKDNPVIMPASGNDAYLPPPQIIGIDIENPTVNRLGRITVHALSSSPLMYHLNDSLNQNDSVFTKVKSGRYMVSVVDSLGRTERYLDTIILKQQAVRSNSGSQPCTNPDKDILQAQINDLFSTRRGDQDLQNEILEKFSSQKVNVTGTLINTTAKYTIYQYLYRQNIGLPGSITIRVTNIGYGEDCKITYFEIQESEHN